MYEEIGVLSAATLAYERLPADGIQRAFAEIAKHIPDILVKEQIFPAPSPDIEMNPAFRPMMRVISESLNGLFSGEQGRKMLIVLGALRKEHHILGEQVTEDGRIEYGIDCFGPYRCVYLKRRPFRRRKPPVVTRASFAEVCLYAPDPKEVYRVTYQLLNAATQYLSVKKGQNSTKR